MTSHPGPALSRHRAPVTVCPLHHPGLLAAANWHPHPCEDRVYTGATCCWAGQRRGLCCQRSGQLILPVARLPSAGLHSNPGPQGPFCPHAGSLVTAGTAAGAGQGARHLPRPVLLRGLRLSDGRPLVRWHAPGACRRPQGRHQRRKGPAQGPAQSRNHLTWVRLHGSPSQHDRSPGGALPPVLGSLCVHHRGSGVCSQTPCSAGGVQRSQPRASDLRPREHG